MEIKSLKELLAISELSPRYAFRGQVNKNWSLISSFEKARTGIRWDGWGELEQKIMLEFKRRAHQYLPILPSKDSHLEWLALMQHYGCPTRLLDFTRSFYVGVFFAVDGAESDAALWAVDTSYFVNSKKSILKEHLSSSYDEDTEQEVNEILAVTATDKQDTGIIVVEPLEMNKRISIQQGVFLFPKNLYKSFEENICAPLSVKNFEEFEKQDKNKQALIKIAIPKKLHTQIAYWLSTMNITAATLFPGLEGFARSQMTHIRYAEYGEKVLNELIIEAMKTDYESKIKAAFEGMKQ